MGQFWSQKAQTPDEVNALRAARTEYQDTLSSIQTNVQTDIQKQLLTPESGKLVLDRVQVAYTWLQKNPTATLIEIYANRDATTAEVKRILTVDRPKKEFQNILLALPVLADEALAKSMISKEQVAQLKTLAAKQTQWFDANAAKGNTLDFQQQELTLQTELQQILVKPDIVQFFKDKIDAIKTKQPSTLESELAVRDQKAKAARDAEVHIEDGLNAMKRTILITVGSLFLIALCIYSGSLAANAAIGRAPAYRILYFCYGFLPIFMPFVLLYTIFRRIYTGPLPYYGILPLTILPGETRLGKLLKFPFYWVPDAASNQLTKQFIESVEKIT